MSVLKTTELVTI